MDEGVVYEGPFSVTDSITVKALAYESESDASGISVASYPRVDTPGHGSGGSFRCGRDLHLASTTEGASIRYTLDGSDPTPANGQLYSEGLRITESAVIRALAFMEDGINSETVTITVDIDKSPIDPPEPSIFQGVFIGPQTLAFDEGEEETSIRYTLDGSEPSLETGMPYDGPIALTGAATVKSRSFRDGCQDSEIREDTYRIYARKVTNEAPINLSGDDVMEIKDTYYVHGNDILLTDNARLVIKDSLLVHQKDFTFQYQLQATGSSKVTVENSGIGNQCNGSLNWNFRDTATFVASNVVHIEGCNTWHLFSNQSTATVDNWDFFGATTCDQARLDVQESQSLELELCFAAGSVIDEALPLQVEDFSFPNDNDSGIDWGLTIRDSSLEGWGIGVPPESDITIRDAPAVTVSIVVGSPWQDQTVELDNLRRQLYEDKTWQIVDSTLRFLNVSTYGWEPNVYGTNNTLVIRDSDFSGSNLSGGDNRVIVENSTMGTMATQERVAMEIRDSTVKGDVIARDDSSITLIGTLVETQVVPGSDGDTVFGDVFVVDNATIKLVNSVVQGQTTTEGNGQVVVE